MSASPTVGSWFPRSLEGRGILKAHARFAFLTVALGCALLVAVPSAPAQQLSFEVRGRVTVLHGNSPQVLQQFASLGIAVGTSVTLDFLVDTTVPGVPNSTNPNYQFYADAIEGFNLRVGGYHAFYQFSLTGNAVQVGNDVPTPPSFISDSYVVTALGGETPELLKGSGTFDVLVFNSVFADANGRTISNDDLMQDLRRFAFGSGAVAGSQGSIGFSLEVGGGGNSRPESIKEYLYVHDGPSEEIRVFGIGSRTGVVTEIDGSPFAVPGGAVNCASATRTIAIDSRGEWLFASTGSGLAILRRDRRSGGLELLSETPIGSTEELAGIALYQKGTKIWIYAADRGPSPTLALGGGPSTGRLRVFEFDSKTASAELLGVELELGPAGSQGSVVATKRFIYATNSSDPNGGIHLFHLDARTGLPTPDPGGPFLAGGAPSNLLIDRKGGQLVTNDEAEAHYNFIDLDSRTGVPLSSRTYDSPSTPTRIFAADKSFRFLYGGGDEGFDILPTRLSSTTSLATSSPIEDGALNKKGTLLFTVSEQDLYVHPIDKRSGLPIVTGTPVVLNGAISERSTGVILR